MHCVEELLLAVVGTLLVVDSSLLGSRPVKALIGMS